jgi:phospholipid/cholesterol/gamma-HCH transport system substrate-binding protein
LKLRKEVKIGLVVVIAISCLIVGINYLKGLNVFKKGREFYAVFDETYGLVSASPVQFNGIKVGQVKGTELVDFGGGKFRILVTIIVDNDILTFSKDSHAKLVSADLLGTKAIMIVPGLGGELAVDGDTLFAEIAPSLQDRVDAEIAPIVVQAKNIMGKLDTIMAGVSAVFGENAEDLTASIESFKISLKNFKTFTESLNNFMAAETGKISSTLTSFQSTALMLQKNNDHLQSIIVNLTGITDTVNNAQLGQTIRNLNSTVSGINEMLAAINSEEGSMGKLIYSDSLHNALIQTNATLNQLIQSITDNPNKYIHFSVFGRKTN